jgi:hypothetical protein
MLACQDGQTQAVLISIFLHDAQQPALTVTTPLSVLQMVTCSAICAAGSELAPPGAGGLQGLSLFSDDPLCLLAEDPSGLANGASQVQASLPMLSKATGLPLSSRAHGSATSQAMRQQGQQRAVHAVSWYLLE